jgi:hypothetical protein
VSPLVREAHDAFLGALGRTWLDPRPLTPGVFGGGEAELVRQRLRTVLETDFEPHAPWALHDPRACRLLPLWLDLLRDRRVVFLHVVRDPLATAGELAATAGLPLAHGLRLWLRCHLEAERHTRGLRRAWLGLRESEPDPRQRVGALAADLGLPAPRDAGSEPPAPPPAAGGVPAASLLGEVHPWIAAAHGVFTRFADSRSEREADIEELERVGGTLAAAEQLLGVAAAPAALAVSSPAAPATANGSSEALARLATGLTALEAATRRLESVAGEMRASDHRIILNAFELARELDADRSRLAAAAMDRTVDQKLTAALLREARLEGEIERQRQVYVSSTSWRLTAPVRAVGRLLQRLGARRA